MTFEISERFPKYVDFDPLVPIWCVTPGEGRCIHRFFDTSPISPSGRYVAVTRLPYEDRLPTPGDVAHVVLIDLATGEERIVAETRGWDTQLGAQVQWGATDSELFFNDVDIQSWRPFARKVDPLTGETRDLDGPVYMVTTDGRYAASPCLLRTARTQAGYGVVAPPDVIPRNEGAPDDDGIYVTDTQTGKSRLLVSIREIVETATPKLDLDAYRDGDFYCAHVKWNPQGDRLMLVLRWKPHEQGRKMRPNLITLRADGSEIHVAIPATEWADKGGHHPNWCPDGVHVMMNLNIAGEGMRLVKARYDGSDYGPMHERVLGSGHPSLHPNGRHVVTDVYLHESLAYGDGTAPLRLIDLEDGTDTHFARVPIKPAFCGPKKELRVDPHPVWDRSFRRIAFNAYTRGTRRVFVADLSNLLSKK